MAVTRCRTAVTFLRQPCVVLGADRKCRIYADRSGQCRAFECGVFKDAQAGRITGVVALRQVKQARKKADAIRQLLRKLGDTDEQRSLGDRFRRTQRRMEAGGIDAEAGVTFAELGIAVHRFNVLAHEKFYTQA